MNKFYPFRNQNNNRYYSIYAHGIDYLSCVNSVKKVLEVISQELLEVFRLLLFIWRGIQLFPNLKLSMLGIFHKLNIIFSDLMHVLPQHIRHKDYAYIAKLTNLMVGSYR